MKVQWEAKDIKAGLIVLNSSNEPILIGYTYIAVKISGNIKGGGRKVFTLTCLSDGNCYHATETTEDMAAYLSGGSDRNCYIPIIDKRQVYSLIGESLKVGTKYLNQ